jgi:hypothetical protein
LCHEFFQTVLELVCGVSRQLRWYIGKIVGVDCRSSHSSSLFFPGMRLQKDFPSDRGGRGEAREDVNLALDRLFTMSCRHRMGGERECNSREA